MKSLSMRFSWAFALFFVFLAAAHASEPVASTSIYNLPATLTDSSGRTRGLDADRGRVVLVTMFYGSCPMACPLLIDTLRAVERALPPQERADARVLMISIDPQRDTVKALSELAKQRHIDTTRWTLARTDEATVRKLAAVLNIQYRRLPNGEFNHSSVITVLSPEGNIAAQSAVLAKADPVLLDAIHGLAAHR